VHNVNNASPAARELTFRTYAVRNVNRGLAGASVLTKCTGRPGPPPLMPQLTFAEPADAPRNHVH
jgi:hypothetical protein